MSGIDWDKVRRNRKLWKPDYREELKWGARPNPLPRPEPLGDPPAPEKAVFAGPLRPSEIRARLKQRGLKGRKLKQAVNAVVSGKELLAWIEFDLECEEMRTNGFVPCPPEYRGNQILLRFRRCSATGEVLEERVYTLTKANS